MGAVGLIAELMRLGNLSRLLETCTQKKTLCAQSEVIFFIFFTFLYIDLYDKYIFLEKTGKS